jgi:hypothetical protein
MVRAGGEHHEIDDLVVVVVAINMVNDVGGEQDEAELADSLACDALAVAVLDVGWVRDRGVVARGIAVVCFLYPAMRAQDGDDLSAVITWEIAPRRGFGCGSTVATE